MVTLFSIFLAVAAVVGLFIFGASRWVDSAKDKAVAEDDLTEAQKLIKDATDANKTRDAVSRDYAAGKPRRMRGKYDLD